MTARRAAAGPAPGRTDSRTDSRAAGRPGGQPGGGAQPMTWSTKHQRQSSPGWNERITG